jgi:integrase
VFKLPGNRSNPWVARKTVGWKDNGQPIYAFVGYYPTRKEALDALEHFNVKPSDRRVTFGECAEAVLSEVDGELSNSAMVHMRTSADRCKRLNKLKMDDVRLADMQPIVSSVSESVGKKTKTFLLKVFSYAVRHEIIPVERPQIVHYIKLSSEKGNVLKRQIFASDEVSAMTDHLDLILLYTGMRVGELLALEEEDVHLDERWLYVKKSKTEAGVRVVPIAERIVHCFDAIPANITYKGYRKRFTKRYKGHLPHDLRHTFVSMCADKGIDERVIKAIVGHAGSGITETVYTHLDLEVLKNAVNML